MATTNNKNDLHREIERTLGIVPGWARQTPATALDGFWALMRDFSMAETALPNKYKELIGLGVSGATRCRYCALYHTEGARLHGASDEEIAEASAMAGISMMGSTYLNARQVDFETFQREMMTIVSYAKGYVPPRDAAQPSRSDRGRH
jgi:AhpD family alkylhydroperoxidase